MGNKEQGKGEGKGKGKGKGVNPRDGKIYTSLPTDGEHAEALADITRAYAKGDMRQARQGALAVVAADPSEEERAFAGLVLARTALDPLALVIGLASFGLFFVIIFLTL